MISTRPSPPSSRLVGAWRWVLPIAIAVMVLAVVTGIGDTSGRPAWIFAAGIFLAVVGAASLLGHLLDLGRREVRDLEKRLEDRLERKESGKR